MKFPDKHAYGRPPGVSVFARALFLLTTAAASAFAASSAPAANWTGKYAPCDQHSELQRWGHTELGVRLSSSNAALNKQFARAIEFWSQVVDFDWHEEDSDACAIQLVDGAKSLFDTPGVAARAQNPDKTGFEGWVAFNPAARLTEHEMFIISVHEIGHLLGLEHNSDGSSVMYFLDLDDLACLDAADLKALGERHTLRTGVTPGGHLASLQVLTP
ncbi:MAG TPA: matrixin family metalloprotease [Bryobacteraceae bacterium]|jgi:hypothetical protein